MDLRGCLRTAKTRSGAMKHKVKILAEAENGGFSAKGKRLGNEPPRQMTELMGKNGKNRKSTVQRRRNDAVR